MSRLSSLVYLPEQVRELDRIAIEELGIPGYDLMTRAGKAVYDEACRFDIAASRWLVLCGAGNNAGDGYVVARMARATGIVVTVAALADPRRLGGDAARAWRDFEAAGGEVVPFTDRLCHEADVIIDAVLGTGLGRPLEGAYLHAVERVNAAGVPVIAVDIPSGLCGATGRVLGSAIRADVTLTFIGRKQGLYLGAGPEHAGRIVFDDLGVPLAKVAHVPPQLRLFHGTDQAGFLPRRPRAAHKGAFGHVLVIGGNEGMAGAVRLAGEAALRAGAGLVTVATRPGHTAAITAARPELMCRATSGPADLEPLLARATVVAVGPGLGQDDWAQALLQRVLQATQPLVVDADALNLLAVRPLRRDSWVLTPHPGEAARLLRCTTAEVQADRPHAVRELCAQFGGVAILKGCGTLVAQSGDLPYLIDAGNPGMASGGMGDLLTGLAAGLLAQHPRGAMLQAAACAAYVHARAGDVAAADGGERGLLAGDLLQCLRPWLNPCD